MRRNKSRTEIEMEAMLRPTLDGVRAQRIGKWTTCEQAHDQAREERASLCPAHQHEWDEARENALTVSRSTPAPITLTHIGSGIDRIHNVQQSSFESWLKRIDFYEQSALHACRAGSGCTVTDPVQDFLPGCDA